MGILFPDRVMGLAQSLTAIVLGLAAPAATAPQSTDASALQAVASSCSGATTPTGGVPAMFCGVNVVRHSYGLRALRSMRAITTVLSEMGMCLNSPGHRANLLSRTWRDVGIATLQGQMFGHDGVTLWVAQFGRRR